MKENEIRLIKDLYNHYDQNQEVNDEFLKSLTENYGTIRGILMNVILKYDPEAEITDEYLDAKLKQYNIDLKSTIQENDANESKEDDVVSTEINGDTQEKPKPVASASKKTKRKWVLPVVIASILIISGGVIFYVKFNDSVTLLDNEIKSWKEELILTGAIGKPCHENSENGFDSWQNENPGQIYGISDNLIISKSDTNDDGMPEALVSLEGFPCGGGNVGPNSYYIFFFSENSKYYRMTNIFDEINNEIENKLTYNEKLPFWFISISLNNFDSQIKGTGSIFLNKDARCCPSFSIDFSYDPFNKLLNYELKTIKIADRDNSYEEEQIRGLLLAEDDRNFNEIIKYYDLNNIKRYWDYDNPTFDLLKTLYLKSWSNTDNSSNTVIDINKVKDKTYDVNLDFSYLDRKDNSYKVVNSNVRFVFNEYGEIIEVYGVETPQYVAQKHGVVVSDKAYFYLTPNFSSNKNGYLIKGDKFTYTNSINGFVNASFTNSKGVTTNGWILESVFLEGESMNLNTLNEKENNQVFKDLGASYFRIRINDNVKNLNIRNYPINGDVITKISSGEIYTVTKVFEASEPIYLLKYEMSFKDIETGEEIKKPADYKLSNLREIGDDIFYAEVFNTDNTINKITLKRNSFKIENNNWLYLKELNGWMYSKFGSKISQNKKGFDNKNLNDETSFERNNEDTYYNNSNLETKTDNLKDLQTKAEKENTDLKEKLEKQQRIYNLEPLYSSERKSSGEFLRQLKNMKEQLTNSYNIDIKEIIIYRIPENDNTKESFTAYKFNNLRDLKNFKAKASEDKNAKLYFENPEKFTLYYINKG